MSPEELIQNLEEFRSLRKKKDHRPDWLIQTIEDIAELFEPLREVARVGYDCQLDENGWLIRMYLGTMEIIGGPKDGQIEHASFRMNLRALEGLFNHVDRMEWYSVGNFETTDYDGPFRSLLSLTGTIVGDHKIQLELLASPPKYAGVGLHKTADGVRTT